MTFFAYTANAIACLTVNSTKKNSKVCRILIVSRTPFFACEVSSEEVRLTIREIRKPECQRIFTAKPMQEKVTIDSVPLVLRTVS